MTLKNHLNLLLVLMFILVTPIQGLHAQVTIGSGIEPAKGALLDLKEADEAGGADNSAKGVLFPRVHLTDMDKLKPMLSGADLDDNTQKLKHKGLVVYNINETAPFLKGLYGWDGAKWVSLANSWNLTGNTGTDPSFNFLGTTDDKDLVFRRNNQLAGHLGGNGSLKTNNTAFGVGALTASATALSGYNVAIGNNSLLNNTSGRNNTAVGSGALLENKSGNDNTAIGFNSQKQNTAGMSNVSLGSGSLSGNEIGDENTALGTQCLALKKTGGYNSVVGNSAMEQLTSGSYNTTIGFKSGNTLESGSHNIAIGAFSHLPANASNQMNIGNTIFGTNMTSNDPAAPAGNIGIGTSTPDASAALEVKAANKGFLPPRVSLTGVSDNATIPNPATGVMVFNTGSNLDKDAYYYNSGTPVEPLWTLLQPYTPSAGVSVKKILYSTTAAPSLDKSVPIGPFKFAMTGDGPHIGLVSNTHNTPTSYTVLIYQMWDTNTGGAGHLNTALSASYDIISVEIPANDSNFVSLGIGGVVAVRGEQNIITLADPATGKIYEVKFILVRRDSSLNHYAIIASEY